MMQKHVFRRMLSLVLTLALLASLAIPAAASEKPHTLTLTPEVVDNSTVTAENSMAVMEEKNSGISLFSDELEPADDEMVRVSIVLEDEATIDAGYPLQRIAQNDRAMSYRAELEKTQEKLAADIQKKVLHGQELDVVWNLTLAANIISANVPASAVDAIESMAGVKSVVREMCYSPDVVSIGGEYRPDMALSSQMTGASQVWQTGYTGAGARIAVVDTGLDTDHQSFSADAFTHALQEDAEKAGMSYDDYAASKDLLDAAKIDSKIQQLNAYKRQLEEGNTLTGADLYLNEKAAFGYNYIDGNLDVTHDNDTQGEHGSHVAGISTANRYLYKGGAFVDAMAAVNVVGNAPDAQILVMKVFGANGGAYDSDILAAIEDAIVLEADSVNLSLGSGLAGFATSTDSTYQALMDRLVECGTVVVNSAGNSGYWAEYSAPGMLYKDGVNYATGGSPGSYTNSLSVASVNNDGTISPTIQVGEKVFGYTEETLNVLGTPFGNEPLASLDTSADRTGTEYDYVFLNTTGGKYDYDEIDVTGKVVFCNRGDMSFVEKGNYAAENGALALIICNNEPGTLSMDLSGYLHTAPVVMITQDEAKYVLSQSEEVTVGEGYWATTYYTGKLSVCGKVTGNLGNSEYLTMSSFSSWGVPGDLSIKPEITAPGGNIYSVNGNTPDTDKYELMSGTSMAAPQISGMAALLSQYLQENGLRSDVLNDRALIQSLLMSTAVPMRNGMNGGYYPVLQQGAGLGSIYNAVRTPVYLTVDGMPDGKVKVELKDDPQRTGEYRFSFQLHNLTGEAYGYSLYADLFTQAIAENKYLDVLTRDLDATAKFTVNGVSLSGGADLTAYDFNGDGKVTKADGQHLLDHVTLGAALTANADRADLSGDGKVTTYDVHVLLSKLSQGMVEVPANGSVTVDAVLTLTAEEKAALDRDYVNGAYVEAYIRAVPTATAEGEALPALGIPVLGFYGNWSDPSMYDVGTYPTHNTGEETRTPYLDNTYTNTLGVVFGDNPRWVFYHGGNPVTPDERYLPERNAINLERGDYIAAWDVTTVRNASAYRMTAENVTTGEAYLDTVGGETYAAYFVPMYQSWMGANTRLELNLVPDMEEGELCRVSVTMAPEMYVDRNGNVDWDALGKGATLETYFTVDNHDPELIGDVTVDLERNVLEVTAKDNQYVAGLTLLDVTGRYILATVGTTADAKPGETRTFTMPLDDVNGYKFILQVSDYASNTVTYRLTETIGDPEPLPATIAYNAVSDMWQIFKLEDYYGDGSYISLRSDNWFESDIVVAAGTAVGQYAFLVDMDRILYVTPTDSMLDLTPIRQLTCDLMDMAYNAADGLLYGVTDENRLVSIDKLTGEVEDLGEIGLDTNTLACDGNGTFYCNKLSTFDVYSFTLETKDAPVFFRNADSTINPSYATYGRQTMTFDAANDKLIWLAHYGDPNYSYYDYNKYYEIPADADAKIQGAYFYYATAALMTPDWTSTDSWAEPTEDVYSLAFADDDVDLILGTTDHLSVDVLPWTLTDKSVTFTSSDESVAAVDKDGYVTGLKEGTVTITASSTLNPAVQATCTVNVIAMDLQIRGALQDGLGKSLLFDWNVMSDTIWQESKSLDYGILAAGKVPAEDAFYLLDSMGSMHKLDLNTGLDMIAPTSVYYDNNQPLWDITYSGLYSTDSSPKIYGIRETTLYRPFDPMNPGWGSFDIKEAANRFMAVAAGGTETITYKDYYGYDQTAESEVVYIVDSASQIWKCNIIGQEYWGEISYEIVYSMTPCSMDMGLSEYLPNSYSSMTVGSDGALYLAGFTGSGADLFRLTYNEETDVYDAVFLKTFGKDVWPAALLTVESSLPAPTAAPKATMYAVADEEAKTEALPQFPTGRLDAVTVETAEAEIGIVVDEQAHTVTVPVQALDSTNGLFTVAYDADVLTLLSANGSAVMYSIETADSSVKVGYADAAPVSSTVATLQFSYDPNSTVTETALTLTVSQDGETEPGATETIPVVLPAPKMENVVLNVYEDGKTDKPVSTYSFKVPHGSQLDAAEINELSGLYNIYDEAMGDKFAGWFNDGGWNHYKATGLSDWAVDFEKLTVNGWTNLYCMVTNVKLENVIVKAVTDGDKANAKTVWSGKAPKGANLVDFLNENVKIDVPEGYVMDQWYNWDWYGHKHNNNATVNGWTNVYVTFTKVPMVNVVVKAVFDGDKSTAKTLWSGKAPKGANLTEWLTDNVVVPEEAGYTADTWYNWDWYGHKHNNTATFSGWTNVYVNYIKN